MLFIIYSPECVSKLSTLDEKFMLLTHIQGTQNLLVVLTVKEGCLISHQSSWKRAIIVRIQFLNLHDSAS